jgi:hypothetical protein
LNTQGLFNLELRAGRINHGGTEGTETAQRKTGFEISNLCALCASVVNLTLLDAQA